MITFKLIAVLAIITCMESLLFSIFYVSLKIITDNSIAGGYTAYFITRGILGLAVFGFFIKCIFELLPTVLITYFSNDAGNLELNDIVTTRLVVILLIILMGNVFGYLDAGMSLGVSIYFKVTLSYMFSILVVYFVSNSHYEKLLIWINGQ